MFRKDYSFSGKFHVKLSIQNHTSVRQSPQNNLYTYFIKYKYFYKTVGKIIYKAFVKQ